MGKNCVMTDSSNLSELYNEYSKSSDVPPPDSLVRWAYEKGEIYSSNSTFAHLNEKDKKTILRIAIAIWNKRKRTDAESVELDNRWEGKPTKILETPWDKIAKKIVQILVRYDKRWTKKEAEERTSEESKKRYFWNVLCNAYSKESTFYNRLNDVALFVGKWISFDTFFLLGYKKYRKTLLELMVEEHGWTSAFDTLVNGLKALEEKEWL